uniref:Uncharacterized protein n=1 Tax=Anguilla anguilla TaxID=7936 RepID=A0A0E9W9U8_ANGAN
MGLVMAVSSSGTHTQHRSWQDRLQLHN